MIRKKSISETQINCGQSKEKCNRKTTNLSTTDYLDSSNSNSQTISLNLRRSYNDKLRKSKIFYKKSLRKVENLKKSHIKCSQNYDKIISDDNPWITSGSFGSKDAVLVFRTSILNMQQSSDEDSCNNSCSSNGSINEISSISSNIICNSTVDQAKNNILDTLPKNNSNTCSNSNLIASNEKPNIKNINGKLSSTLTTLTTSSSSSAKSDTSMTILSSPKKKNLHNKTTLSCRRRNSISSECGDDDDNDNDTEDDILYDNDNYVKVTNKISKIIKNNTSSSSSSLQCNKNVSFDDKENLVINDSETSGSIDMMPAKKLNITYKLLNTETKLLKKMLISHGLIEAKDDQSFNILWTGMHIKPDILRNLMPYQRVNHFPRSYELTRKDRLYKNIVKMQHLRGYKHFDIVPQSFILPLEYRDLVSAHNKQRGPWIVKPAASSRGRGIFLVNSPDQIQTEEQVLVSKYIVDPLCIDGHKCDLRVYVVVTSYDPLIVYMYEEGLVRLATVKYEKNAENLWNPCMHLCNYSINKYHSDYIKSDDAHDEDVGHKWTLSALLRHLKVQGCDIKQLMSNIEDIIIKSIFACAQSIISACRMFVPNNNNCFELYGFDILIDSNLKPWLLEVNLSPSLGVDSPLDVRVKASLIADLLTLIGIPAYSQTMRSQIDAKCTRFRRCSGNRRANSADHLNNSGKRNNYQPKSLSNEEIRILKNVKLQNARKGGFVRIFPHNESMQRYGSFLDPITGIPMSIAPSTGTTTFSMVVSHNFNYLLYKELFNKGTKNNLNNLDSRMQQYERILETSQVNLGDKKITKCLEEGKRLKKQIRKLIENGNEFTQLQARQAFTQYLECVLKRLCQEPREYHEKLILKFINRISDNFRAPMFFHNPLNYRVSGKDRSAIIAKLLSDFLQSYIRDTENYIESCETYNMIPMKLFNEFLSHAQESDLETILTLHTNLTQIMPFLYNHCAGGGSGCCGGGGTINNIPPTPPIPCGPYGFLKALPSMVPLGYSRDQIKIDNYYKIVDSKVDNIQIQNVDDDDDDNGGGDGDANNDNDKKKLNENEKIKFNLSKKKAQSR